MGRSTFFKLFAICLISSTVPSTMALSSALHAAQAIGLVSRQTSSCGGNSALKPCGGAFPSDFCCGLTSTCMAFNGNASVICCPQGKDCRSIIAVICDTSILNATAFPANPMHSTDLTSGGLQSCGNNCCPRGFTCLNNACFLDKSNSSATSVASPSSTGSSTGSSTTVISVAVTPTPTETASSSTSTQLTNASVSCSAYPINALLIGFFPGLVIGIFLAIVVILIIGRCRRSPKKSSTFNTVTAKVSDPIYQESGATRTDFLRREPKPQYSPDPTSIGSSPASTTRTSRVRSLFHKSPSLHRRRWDENTDALGVVHTPERQIRKEREPSMESITIYSPPEGHLDRQTTFGDFMAAAEGEAKTKLAEQRAQARYMGSPARVNPRSKEVGI